MLEQAFGCSLVNTYGCGEHLRMGAAPPGASNIVLTDHDLVYEFYPDHSVVTNLFNYTMPLIRYRMSDVLRPVELGAHAPYLVIESLVSRNELQPVFKNGDGDEDFISPHTINEIFVAGVTRFQMHLLGPEAFRFMVCLDFRARCRAARGGDKGSVRSAQRDSRAQTDGQHIEKAGADRPLAAPRRRDGKHMLGAELAEYRAKLAAREAKQKASGRKPGGKPPEPPVEGPRPTDQINLTDEESRIMPVSGGGFEQCYNAQAVVAESSLLVVASDVAQAPNDKQQLEPMLAKTGVLPKELGEAETMLADNGYFSEANVKACGAAGVEPLIALGRDAHHQSLRERFADAPPPLENPTPVEAMAHRLQTPEGKKLYAKRKHTPEPVFGIIKSILGFRQFLLRGLEKVKAEWTLVTLAWNMKRMFALKAA